MMILLFFVVLDASVYSEKVSLFYFFVRIINEILITFKYVCFLSWFLSWYMHILYTTNKMTSCKSDSSYNPFASMMYLVYKPPTSTDISALAPLWYGSLNNLIEWVQFHYNRNHERTEMNTFNMKLSQLITAKSLDIKIFIPQLY